MPYLSYSYFSLSSIHTFTLAGMHSTSLKYAKVVLLHFILSTFEILLLTSLTRSFYSVINILQSCLYVPHLHVWYTNFTFQHTRCSSPCNPINLLQVQFSIGLLYLQSTASVSLTVNMKQQIEKRAIGKITETTRQSFQRPTYIPNS